jgi:hypothetical protein
MGPARVEQTWRTSPRFPGSAGQKCTPRISRQVCALVIRCTQACKRDAVVAQGPDKIVGLRHSGTLCTANNVTTVHLMDTHKRCQKLDRHLRVDVRGPYRFRPGNIRCDSARLRSGLLEIGCGAARIRWPHPWSLPARQPQRSFLVSPGRAGQSSQRGFAEVRLRSMPSLPYHRSSVST